MPIRSRVRRLSRDLKLAIHLTIQTAADIIWSLVDVRCQRSSRPVVMRREFAKIVRYSVRSAIDKHDSFPVDGDFNGRRPSQLPPHTRRERRAFADRRRRHVTVLLDALGDAPQTVLARLARQGQFDGCERYDGLIEAYLATRLRHRDPHALYELDVCSWACNVGGTWIATPRPVRRYLRHRSSRERHLRGLLASTPAR